MQKVHSHYENLKVSRTADQQEIRLAYKRLMQKVHPDKAQNESERVLFEKRSRLINTAYQVLGDPAQRQKHDRWIAEQEYPRSTYSKPASVFAEAFKKSRFFIRVEIEKAIVGRYPILDKFFYEKESFSWAKQLEMDSDLAMLFRWIDALTEMVFERNQRLQDGFIIPEIWIENKLRANAREVLNLYCHERDVDYLRKTMTTNPTNRAYAIVILANRCNRILTNLSSLGIGNKLVLKLVEKYGVDESSKLLEVPFNRGFFKAWDLFYTPYVNFKSSLKQKSEKRKVVS